RTSGGDHGDLATNQIGRQLRQAVGLVVSEAVYDRHVLALNEALLLKALAEFAQALSKPVRRGAAEEPDHRHCCRLRARGEWTSRRCAAEQGYQLASSHSITSSASPMSLSDTLRPRVLAVLMFST